MKIVDKLRNEFGDDGLLHITVSALACILLGLLGELFLPLGVAVGIAVVFTIVLGLGKEMSDAASGKKADVKDVACDLIGIAIALFILAVASWI